MSSELSPHLLATPLHSLGHVGYPIEDNIELYLDTLYKGRLYETLAEGYPGPDITRNLADIYAEISALIFWGKDDAYEEALRAFPLFVDYLSQTVMDVSDLHNLYRISCNFRDGVPDGGGPDHLSHLDDAVETISAIVCSEPYRSTIENGLRDKVRPDHDDLIDLAVWFHGADEFELHFEHAQFDPVRGLREPHWLVGMNEEQGRRFMAWVRQSLPRDLPARSIARTQDYSERERAVLSSVLSHSHDTVRRAADRHDLAVWGLSSSDISLACKGAWLLEALPLSEWPTGSVAALGGLSEAVDPHWVSWKEDEQAHLNAKDRLGALLQIAQS
ncbi:hypothetical protein [Henriciella aquimarina]|uniref:hypothetical protein n=1 Tax=Henriciella aquimarina TaxID=545261 RepID=UPI00117AA846|nr:hypothetical protein [Henriciella aquimarina]